MTKVGMGAGRDREGESKGGMVGGREGGRNSDWQV